MAHVLEWATAKLEKVDQAAKVVLKDAPQGAPSWRKSKEGRLRIISIWSWPFERVTRVGC